MKQLASLEIRFLAKLAILKGDKDSFSLSLRSRWYVDPDAVVKSFILNQRDPGPNADSWL